MLPGVSFAVAILPRCAAAAAAVGRILLLHSLTSQARRRSSPPPPPKLEQILFRHLLRSGHVVKPFVHSFGWIRPFNVLSSCLLQK